MQAWVVERRAPIDRGPRRRIDRALPELGPGQVRVAATCCGVCRTDLQAPIALIDLATGQFGSAAVLHN